MINNSGDGKRKDTSRLPEEACCGCGACSAACPIGCIDMQPDSLGFLRPSVQVDRCVSCGRCESACPSLNPNAERDTFLGAFWMKSGNKDELAASSSGGVFGLLASKVLAEGGSVYGAVWAEDWRVVHVRIDDASRLNRLKKSKYVQSEIGAAVYESVSVDLSAGRKVLYSGTGCQIAALKSYLGEGGSNNLLCVEVICHGAPSPKLWRLYVNWMEQGRGARLLGFSFREKDPDWERYSVRAEFSDGSSWQVPYMECWYMAAFMSDLPLRPSCHSCPFKRRSGSDVVLGDFWGIRRLGLGIEAREGVSAVVANTEKGLMAIRELSDCERGAVDYADILTGNRSLEFPAPAPKGKSAFVEELENASDLSPLISRWDFSLSRKAVWKRRASEAKGLASECGKARTMVLFVKVAGKAVVLMAKGANKETLRKMVQVAVEELREKTGGGFVNACKNVIRPVLGKPRVLPDEINWPKGFLALGIAEYAGIGLGDGASLCDHDERERIVAVLQDFFDSWISKGMRLQNLDDAVAGCVLLRLAVETDRQDYFAASDAIYDFLRNAHTDPEGALCYFVGQGSDYVLVDGIGQSSMFLYDYARARNNEDAYSMGLKQLELFVSHAIDDASKLPYHGYILDRCDAGVKEVKQGIIGWGRGVGWLLLGMSRYREMRDSTSAIAKAAKELQTENGLWAWQLCATGGPRDTSGTAMIAYSLAVGGFDQDSMSAKAVQGLLECTAPDGCLMSCLDDGRGISQHPQNYGHYPWGQGIALALLSLHARNVNELQAA